MSVFYFKKTFFSLSFLILLIFPFFNLQAEKIRGYKGVVITEIFPNPEGKDKNKEWIEIYNTSNSLINLKGWILKDLKSKPYVIKNNLFIEDDEYLLLKRQKTKIILNNQKENLTLYTPEKQIADSVYYLQAPENKSYSFIDNKWVWTKEKTPGNKNKDEKKEEKENLQAGKVVEIKGRVKVVPKNFSSQYFYIDTLKFGLIQIYNHYKIFPKLKREELIKVKGEVSEIKEGFRIKTKEAKDIKKIKEDNLITFSNLEGKIEKEEDNFYLLSNKEKIEINSSSINVKFKPGSLYNIRGVLKSINKKVSLTPRDEKDIFLLEERASSTKENLIIEEEKTKNENKIYVYVALIFFAFSFFFYLFKRPFDQKL